MKQNTNNDLPGRFVRDLPAYTYVPGQAPHPINHPDGHSFGQHVTVSGFEAVAWYDCDVYLRGIELFNLGYYWESHEQWEAVWNAAGRRGPVADFLKGLIKLAASGVKRLERLPVGAQRHAERAAELFRQLAHSHTELMGMNLNALVKFAGAASRGCDETVIRNGKVSPVWHIRLEVSPPGS